MSTADVGDAVQLTFETLTGATVTVSWYDPDEVAVLDAVTVTETPASSGLYPKTLTPTRAGVWKAVFTASGLTSQVETFYLRAVSTTGPAPLATLGDVAELYGTLTATQTTLVAGLLRHASRLVRWNYPTLDEDIAAGTVDADNVALAVTTMVLRVLRNPSGMRSETVGPFTRTFYDTKDAAAGLVITDAEAVLLAATTTPAAASPVGTIMVRPGLAPTPTGLTDVYRWRY